MANDPINQLQQMAQENISLAEGLRKKREALSQAFNRFYAETQPQNIFQTPEGIPLQPSKVMSVEEGLRNAFQRALSPYSPESELSARNSAANLLMDLLQLEQKQARSGSDVLMDLLNKRDKLKKAGFDTTEIDNAIAQEYGLKPKTSAEVSPDKMLDAVKDRFGASGAKEVADKVSFLKDATSILKRLEPKNKNFFENLFVGPTGPIATTLGDILGANSPDAQLRADIDTFKENIRKDLYGSAFTETEKKIAVLPGSGKQESTNVKRLRSLVKRKVNEVKSRLIDAGYNEGQINNYFRAHGIDLSVINGGTNTTRQDDPLGILGGQ